MQTFKIEKRYSKDILLEGAAETFKEFVEKNKSNLSGSNLSGSDLSDSDLRGSNLSGSNLSGSNLRWVKIKMNQKDKLLQTLRIEIID